MTSAGTLKPGGGNSKTGDAARLKARRESERQKKARLKEKAKNNKGCQVKKKTSKGNRQKVNEKKNREKPRCSNPRCGKTANKSSLDRKSDFEQMLPGTRGKERAEIKKKIEWWGKHAKRGKLEADHKFSSSKIKDLKSFKELEVADPAAARGIMELDSNMRGLCKPCNAALGARSGFQGTKIKAMIKNALKEAYKVKI